MNRETYSNFFFETALNTYIDNNINYNFTFTNTLIEEKHLSDVFGNYVAKIGKLDGNGVIVASELMKNYIRENYIKIVVPKKRDEKINK